MLKSMGPSYLITKKFKTKENKFIDYFLDFSQFVQISPLKQYFGQT